MEIIDYSQVDDILTELMSSSVQPPVTDELPVTEIQNKPVVDEEPDIDARNSQIYTDRHVIAAQGILEDEEEEEVKPLKQRVLDFVQSLTIKQYVTYGLAGLVAVSTMAFYAKSSKVTPDVSKIAPTTWDESYFAANSPLNLTQTIKSSSTADTYKKALASQITSWDIKVNESLTKNIRGAMDKEAVRLRNEAEKEAASGTITVTDRSQQVFDIKNCSVQTLQPVKCILLRYALEGADQMVKGDSTNDLTAIVSGWARYRSAMRALGSSELVMPNTSFVLLGAASESQIKAMREVLTLNPTTALDIKPVSAQVPGDAVGSINSQPVQSTSAEVQDNATP